MKNKMAVLYGAVLLFWVVNKIIIKIYIVVA